MAQLKLGPKFFRKERDNLYSDWPTGFFREDLQNSIDAGASVIEFNIHEDKGETIISVGDNGCGMTRDIIENKFFVLGETTKEGPGTVGGFGRARILTCFSMDWYELQTGNLLVQGKSSEYEIAEVDSFRKGCLFRVGTKDKTVDEMRQALIKVLSCSQLDCAVLVNGVRYTNWLRKYRLTREISCGSVYVNKSQNSGGRIIVRVKGLYTFDCPTDAIEQVIVEIDPEKSREVLTVNRDSMHYKYQNNLQSFLTEIAVDKRSALRSRVRMTTLIKGNGFIVSHARNPKLDFAGSKGSVAEVHEIDTSKTHLVQLTDIQRAAASVPVHAVRQEVVDGQQFATNLPAIYINDETELPAVRKAMKAFDPRKWVYSVKSVRGKEQRYRKGSTYLKLLMAWKTACEEAVRALLSCHQIDSLTWMVGWDFSESDARHCSFEGNVHAICLNPVDNLGNLKYSIRKKASLLALMALAKHEVAHVAVSYHNEDFSTMHTAIDEIFDPFSTLRKMREASAAIN